MILADKIIENRKKNGWSQEELAEKLGVSRQSVSKWEGAQSIPDMKKILQMAELFGVSTDYLLKDEIDEMVPEVALTDTAGADYAEEAIRHVSLEEANEFLEHNEKAAKTVSTGVMLCILSPVVLIAMGGIGEFGKFGFTAGQGKMIGLVILFCMVAVAVAMFIKTAMRGKKYEYLEKMNIETEYGVSGMAKERRSNYADTHTRLLIIGILLCVICAVPMFIMYAVKSNDDLIGMAGVDLILILVAAGVKMIVLTCIRQGGFDKLLEEGDYTRLNKKVSVYDGIYWILATAVYLTISFITMRWQMTWIVWPVAGVLFAAYHEIMKMIVKSKNRMK